MFVYDRMFKFILYMTECSSLYMFVYDRMFKFVYVCI